MFRFFGTALLALLMACQSQVDPTPTEAAATVIKPTPQSRADTIVFTAIEAAGGWGLDSSTLAFRFRDGVYGVDQRNGNYVYTRTFTDSLGREVDDLLSNDGFRRSVGGRRVQLSPKLDSSAREALNSVIYFALLPRPLADGAARRNYVGPDTLRGRAYHLIEVTFSPDGGGVDHEDRFLYWFDVADLSLDYLAYAYATNGGGVRFREAFNTRRVGGITVQDYRNYRADPEKSIPIDNMATAWSRGELELMSTVALEEVQKD